MLTRTTTARGTLVRVARGSFAIALTASALTAMPGCGVLCSDSRLSAEPAILTDGPITLSARFTSHGDPVAGGRLAFYSLARGSSGEEGNLLGQATTGPDGVARVVVVGGREELARRNATLFGYEVTFDNLAKIDGERYCESKARADLS